MTEENNIYQFPAKDKLVVPFQNKQIIKAWAQKVEGKESFTAVIVVKNFDKIIDAMEFVGFIQENTANFLKALEENKEG